MDATILVEYVWSAAYQPWLTTSFPWQTATPNGSIVLSTQTPTTIQGTGVTVTPAVDSIVVSIQGATIVEGQGISTSVGVQNITLTLQNVDINYDYTTFPSAEVITINQITPNKVGQLWEIRVEPSSAWVIRTEPTSNWENRNQVLWSPFVFPWASTFFPWQVQDRRQIPTFTTRTKPTTSFPNRTKPTTSWQRLR